QLCVSTDPGVKLRITKNGIEYANKVAHAEIVKQLKALSIPEQSGQDGHLSYNIYNIRFTNLVPPASSISLVPGSNGISWALSNFAISVEADWRVKYKKGIVGVSVSGLNVAETAGFGIDGTGRPSIASKGCSCSIGSVGISFHGGTAFILNLFRKTVERKMREAFPPKICEAVVKVINNEAEKSLSTMVVTVDVAKRFLVDYRLVAPPAITADYIEIWDKGEVFWKADVKEAPFSPQPIPAWTDNSRMLYIWVTDYTPNTFFYQAHTNGYLKYNVTKKDLPDDRESYLNTTCTLKCIGTIIPQIGWKYPNSVVEFGLRTSAVPKATMSANTLTAELSSLVDMMVRTPSNELVFLATLNVNLSLTVQPNVVNQNLNGKITDYSFKLTLEKSAIGPLFPSVLNTVINGVLSFVVVPKLNVIAAKGVQLPMVGDVQFSNTMLLLQEGNLLIGTDLQYKVDNVLRFQGDQYRVIQL
ncbi:bactericidal permeability increasing protein, partial [Elysia marginata]